MKEMRPRVAVLRLFEEEHDAVNLVGLHQGSGFPLAVADFANGDFFIQVAKKTCVWRIFLAKK
jgi:hypothetical protein